MYIDDAQKKRRKMSREEEIELIRRAQQGDIQARNRVVEQHLLLVIFLARNRSREDIADLIHEGNMALIRAVGDFRMDRGTQFNTFAGKYIKTAFHNYFKKKARRLRSISLDQAIDIEAPNGFTDQAIFLAILERAPLKPREKFILARRLEGYVDKEIAAMLGISKQWVFASRRKALKKLVMQDERN